MPAKFGIPYSLQSPYIGQNLGEGISEFQISGQSLMNKNCHNSRSSNDIDMKLGPVTKLDKKNTTTSKILHGNIMAANHNVKFDLEETGGQVPDAWAVILTFSLIATFSTFYLKNFENRTKKSITQISYYCF